MAGAPLFAFDDVSVTVAGGISVLDGVTAQVPVSGVTCFVGASGSGKSSLLRLCNRLGLATSGTVRFRGDDVTELDPLALRRRAGMVFQRPTPFPGTVRGNLEEAAPDAGDDYWGACLERAELPQAFLDRDVAGLSGGEAQRVCVARALATEPEVLLLDEPTSALDPAARRALESLATRVARECAGVVWVTHDHTQVLRLADHVLVLDNGRVVASGPADAVREHLDG